MHFPQPEPAFLECHGWLAVLRVGKFYSLRQLCDLASFSQQVESSSCCHLLKSFSFFLSELGNRNSIRGGVFEKDQRFVLIFMTKNLVIVTF